MSPNPQLITSELSEGVTTITLNRPEKRNALSYALLVELENALWEADADKRVHCVVIKGAGSCFSSGYDLRAYRDPSFAGEHHPQRTASTIDDDLWYIERSQHRLRVLWDMHKPTIAQVHGNCLAGGTDLALFCDLVIVADDALLGFPPVRDMGAPPNSMWLYHAGPQWAKRLLMTGDLISGADAARIGLALKSMPLADLDDEVGRLAARLALIDPDLLSANKRAINFGLELMGASTMQRFAAETDARGHRAPSTKTFFKAMKEGTLVEAFAERAKRFGSGRARVSGPDERPADLAGTAT